MPNDEMKTKWLADQLADTLSAGKILYDELQSKLVREHFGKYVVMRIDTCEYWICETESEARSLTLRKVLENPALPIATIGCSQITGVETSAKQN